MSRFNRIAVVGAGLIGGSVLMALLRRKSGQTLAGWSHSKKSRDFLGGFKGVEVFEAAKDAAIGADLVIIATPVDKIKEAFVAIAPALKPGAIVTDVGSVKASVLRDALVLPPKVTFIGSHPMAGSEKAGIAQAKADLFEGRLCFITPSSKEDPAALSALHDFWQGLGSVVRECSAEQHDAIVAVTSHVPHATASALMLAVAQAPQFDISAAGSGLRDTTRIAAGEENLWVSILLSNAENVVSGLNAVEKNLRALREAIASGDKEKVAALLKEARQARQSLDPSR
jgi:prephenate dehydrogenase